MLNPGAEFKGVISGEEDGRVLILDAGYGFIARLGDLQTKINLVKQ